MSQRRLLMRVTCVAGLALGTGCAGTHSATQPIAIGNLLSASPTVTRTSDSASTAQEAKAHLALDQIKPIPTLPPALRPTTDPSGPAPTQSLLLYAQAMEVVRLAQTSQTTEQQGDDSRQKAIGLLEQAVAVDPYSYELSSLLGSLYVMDGNTVAKGLDSFENAAAIRPDDVEIQGVLGRDYLAEHNLPQAIWHLRLAQQTTGYRRLENQAAIVDRFLAEALESSGYFQAAVQVYSSLRDRIRQPTEAMRYDAEIGPLVENPLPVWVKIASLQERLGQHALAVATYKEAATTQAGNATDLVKAMFDEYDRQDQVEPAAQLVINQLADHPHTLREMVSLIDRLVAPARRDEITIATLQNITVPASSESAKQFLIAQVAGLRRRDALERDSLQKSVAVNPPFEPAYRESVAAIWARVDWDDARKKSETKTLVDKATAAGNKSLALELDARSLISQNKPQQAVDELAKAMAAAKTPSPDLQVAYAEALIETNNLPKSQEVLKDLTTAYPGDDDAWQMLFNVTLKSQNPEAARKVLMEDWLAVEPGSIKGRLQQAAILDGGGDLQAAQDVLVKLETEHSDDSEVLDSLMGFCVNHQKVAQFVALMMQRHAQDPRNRRVVGFLVEILGPQRPDDALKVLNDLRTTLSGDADGLYSISPLYQSIGHKELTEEVLQDVLKIDAKNAAANNDLGYDWADGGKNLPQAEKMIRAAVDAEPDNQSYLDSMGWVLYKRGKFDQAKVFMEKAIDPASQPDPIVLNHYGDVLYRLGDIAGASKVWQRAKSLLGQVDPSDDEHVTLLRNLTLKIQQVDRRTPADVAPVGAELES
jgi:tetratricopeptide (TPR) repeat protein